MDWRISTLSVTLIQQTPNPIETIAQIASICYDSDPKDPMKLVERLYRSGHHSVFEHIWFTFKIEGISRACSHQLVRHRLCAFTQRSQRYCAEDSTGVIEPPSVAMLDEEDRKAFSDAVKSVRQAYEDLVKLHNVPKEDARYLLPNGTQTSLYLSCNLRELIHIANERLCTRAQWEIRFLVRDMAALVDERLRWMLVPKCAAGQKCPTPCWQKEGVAP